jgi:hypothetical protein
MNAAEERSFRDFVVARGPALPRWGGIEAPEAYLRQAMYRHQVSWWRRPGNRNESLPSASRDRDHRRTTSDWAFQLTPALISGPRPPTRRSARR